MTDCYQSPEFIIHEGRGAVQFTNTQDQDVNSMLSKT